MLRHWYERLKPICADFRRGWESEPGSFKLLDEDLQTVLLARRKDRRYIYKPSQVAAVQAARLTPRLGFDTKKPVTIGMNQASEIMRLLSEG
jgi:hypothetical protein